MSIVAPFAPWGVSIRGKFVLLSPGGKWAQETCPGYHQQRCAMGKPGKVHGRDRVGGSCGYWARGSVFGEHSRKSE